MVGMSTLTYIDPTGAQKLGLIQTAELFSRTVPTFGSAVFLVNPGFCNVQITACQVVIRVGHASIFPHQIQSNLWMDPIHVQLW